MAFLPENIFKKIISKEIPADIVYEDDLVLAFHDIKPAAKTHILIIPKQEIVTAMDITDDNKYLFAELYVAAKKIAADQGLTGYKLVMNVGEEGGQVIPHVHLHLLSSDYQTAG